MKEALQGFCVAAIALCLVTVMTLIATAPVWIVMLGLYAIARLFI